MTASDERRKHLERLCPIGEHVMVYMEDGGDGVFVLPPIKTMPKPRFKGYDFAGWGRVTDIRPDSKYSHGGSRPIVVMEHLYCSLEEQVWNQYLKEEEK